MYRRRMWREARARVVEASLGKEAWEPNSERWMGFGHPEMAEGILGQGNSFSKGTEAGVGGAYPRNRKGAIWPEGRWQTGTRGPHPGPQTSSVWSTRTDLQGVLEKGTVHLQSQKVNNEAGAGGGRALES